MRNLFLYGNLADNFEALSHPFMASAGGSAARIALLMSAAHGWEPFLHRYRDPWLRVAAAEIEVLTPEAGTGQPSPETLVRLRSCTAVFMAGGDTRQYHHAWVRSEARDTIREMYGAGIPYGGVSAGALLAPTVCSIWGDRLTTCTNRLTLRGSEDGCDGELLVGEGLGLLGPLVTEAHFSEQGGFARLVAAMEQTGAPMGLGFDDSICVQVEDGEHGLVQGRGRAYLMVRQGPGRLKVQVLEPGERFRLG